MTFLPHTVNSICKLSDTSMEEYTMTTSTNTGMITIGTSGASGVSGSTLNYIGGASGVSGSTLNYIGGASGVSGSTLNYIGGGYLTNNGGSNYFTFCQPSTFERDLSKSPKELSVNGKELIKNKLYTIPESLTYDRLSPTYTVLIENDLDGDISEYTQIKDFFQTRRSLMVVAYDTILNRLEFTSICKEEEPISNIDMLLDTELQIKPNKTDYFSSLKSNFLPIINYKVRSIEGSTFLLEKNTKTGLLPAVHMPNYIYNLQNLKKEPVQKASKLLDSLLCEAYLIDKSGLPEIQKYFSPEYCYISLLDKKEINKALNIFNKSKQGLIELLQNITIPGTPVIPFVEAVISQCALNQSILNIEEYAYITIRNLIETNIC